MTLYQIKIFDHSITFFNPGSLYGDLTIEDLHTDKYHSHARNKLIAEAFYLTKDIEKYGSGYIRIRSEVKDYPTMKFDYREMGNGFLTELSYTEQKITKDITDRVTDRVTDNQRKILNHLHAKNNITTAELSELIGISQRKIKENISKLKTEQILHRIGPAKGGHWEILWKQEK